MTYSRQYTIWCDGGCSEWVQFSVRNLRTAEKKARENGWAVHDDGHYCPDHNTKT